MNDLLLMKYHKFKIKDMGSRETILYAIKNNKPDLLPLPPSTDFGSNNSNLVLQFSEVLESIGGTAVSVQNYEQIKEYLKKHNDLTNIAVTIPELSELATFSLNTTDPHDLETIDLAIIAGQTAVAENAAVWISDTNSPHRALLFITQYLMIVIKKSNIVSTLHKAYQDLKIDETGWGCWVSGPSKTADIEQSMVIGAHGARGLIVFIMD